MQVELEGMLREPSYMECFMIKTPLAPLKKNHKTQFLFAMFFAIVIFTQLTIILPVQKSVVMGYLVTISGFITATAFFAASVMDPGYLKNAFPFLDLLKQVHPCEMCPDCEVMRSTRSKHCAICNRCVERFDHHCPWINNCVGAGNHNAFMTFITSMIFTLLFIVISCSISFGQKCEKRHPDDVGYCPLEELCWGGMCKVDIVKDILAVSTICLSVFFFLPVALLCSV